MKVGPQEVLHCSNRISVVGGRGEDFPLDLTAYANWHWSFAEQNTSLFWLHLQLHFPPFLRPTKVSSKAGWFPAKRSNESFLLCPPLSAVSSKMVGKIWKYSNPGPILSSSTFTQIDVVIAGQSQGYLLLNLITPRSRIVEKPSCTHTHRFSRPSMFVFVPQENGGLDLAGRGDRMSSPFSQFGGQ